MIPYGRHSITEEDIQAVVEVLRSERITQGEMVPAFERAVADYCGCRHAVAVNSGTSALHLACLAMGLGPGDWLWTSPITFVATANCALYCGARVDFVDVEPDTGNMDMGALEEKLARTPAERLPRLVTAVHFAGQPCDMARLAELGGHYGFRVLEDASHALGARYRQRAIGACEYSDAAVFSFHPVKMITTGEGGMVATNDPELAERITDLRSHGVTRDPKRLRDRGQGAWYYEQQALGFNYRLTDLQAALGHAQLKRLPLFLEKRKSLAARYDQALASTADIQAWAQRPDRQSSYHLYGVRVTNGRRRQVFDQLQAAGVGVNVHYIPVYWQPWYRQQGFETGHCPVAETWYQQVITLPLFPDLTGAEQARVIQALGGD